MATLQFLLTTNTKQSGWTNSNYNLSNYEANDQNKMHQMVLLDSDSTNTIFCNKEYVNNIRPAPKPLEIQTNGGIMKVNHICEIPYLGTQWFSKNAITNIISLADITKNYRVTMDTDKEKAMIIHLDNRKIKFNEMPGGLYAREPKGQKNINSTDKINESQHLYLTVGDNYKYLSSRQIKKRKK